MLKRVKRNGTHLILLLLIAALLAYATASAESVADKPLVATIRTDEPVYLSDRIFTVNVTVVFIVPSYIHDSLFLSYHVNPGAPDGPLESTSLRYENDRIPLIPDASGTAVVQMEVDLADVEGDPLYVCYDIVDLQNLFWYADSPLIETDFAYTKVSNNIWAVRFGNFVEAIADSPVLFAINALILVASIILVAWIVKRKVFSLK